MSFSNYLEDKLLDHTFKGSTFTQPTNLYVSLHTGDPGETGANEVGGALGYSRKLHNTWNAASGGSKTNNGAVTFDAASGAGYSVTHCGVWDDPTGGNFLGGGTATNKTFAAGDIPQFSTGQLNITLD